MSVRKFGAELLTDLLTHTMKSVPGCVGMGLSLAKRGSDGAEAAPHSVAAVGVAGELDHAQWSRATGPLWEAFRTGQIVQRPQLPEFARDGTARTGELDAAAIRAMDAAGGGGERVAHARHLLGLERCDSIGEDLPESVRGAVFSTGEWGGELPVVVSVYLDKEPDGGTLEEIDRHEPLLTQALALIEYCGGEEVVAEQMVQMTQYRRVIEQAKGLVMGATGKDASGAFETMARASQHFNVRLRHLAVALVEHVGSAPAEHPDDPELVVSPSPNDREVAARVWAALSAGPILAGDSH